MRFFDIGARPGPQRVQDRVFTAANAISFVRLLGLPLFVWLMVDRRAYGQAFAVLVLIGSTDWIDGYVARRFDQVTRLGQVMDPLIDRLMLATSTLTLLAVGFLPWPVVAAILGRDVLLFGGALAMFGGLPPIPVSKVGKLATTLLFIGVPAFLLGHMDWPGTDTALVVAWTASLAGIAAYYVGGLQYARIAVDLKRRR